MAKFKSQRLDNVIYMASAFKARWSESINRLCRWTWKGVSGGQNRRAGPDTISELARGLKVGKKSWDTLRLTWGPHPVLWGADLCRLYQEFQTPTAPRSFLGHFQVSVERDKLHIQCDRGMIPPKEERNRDETKSLWEPKKCVSFSPFWVTTVLLSTIG